MSYNVLLRVVVTLRVTVNVHVVVITNKRTGLEVGGSWYNSVKVCLLLKEDGL